MKTQHTHYDNLKVARNAPPEVIRAAYKSLAQKYHPDKFQDPVEAERIIKIINASYELLMDPEARAKYDISLAKKDSESIVNQSSTGYNLKTEVNPPNTSPSSLKEPKENLFKNRTQIERDDSFIDLKKVTMPIVIYGLVILTLLSFITILNKDNFVNQKSKSKATSAEPLSLAPSNSDVSEAIVYSDTIKQTSSSSAPISTSSSASATTTNSSLLASKLEGTSSGQIMRNDQADISKKDKVKTSVSYETAETLFSENRFLEAELALDTLISQTPNDPASWRLKGLIQASRGNVGEASKAFQTYVQTSSSSEEAITSLKKLAVSKDSTGSNIRQAANQALINIEKK